MEYSFSPRALKDISKLPVVVQRRLIRKLNHFVIQEYPLRYAETLINSALGQYRFRVGDYRVIFDMVEGKIKVLRVGHRQSIYK